LVKDKTAFYSLWREYGAPYRLSMREFRYWKLVYPGWRPYNVPTLPEAHGGHRG